jgi:hypothetical protein
VAKVSLFDIENNLVWVLFCYWSERSRPHEIDQYHWNFSTITGVVALRRRKSYNETLDPKGQLGWTKLIAGFAQTIQMTHRRRKPLPSLSSGRRQLTRRCQRRSASSWGMLCVMSNVIRKGILSGLEPAPPTGDQALDSFWFVSKEGNVLCMHHALLGLQSCLHMYTEEPVHKNATTSWI